MNKIEWENCYNELNEIFSKYHFEKDHHDNGRNKTIRKEAGRKMDEIVNRAKSLICNNEELLSLVDDPKEFFSYQWFYEDIQNLLMKVEKKIL